MDEESGVTNPVLLRFISSLKNVPEVPLLEELVVRLM